MMKKVIYLGFFLVLLLVVFWKLNDVKVVLPNDVQSVSNQLITIDILSSPKIIISTDLSNIKDSLPFIEHIQKEISINQVRINDVYLVISGTTETSRNDIILFLEKNNIILQTIIDSDKRIEKQFDMESSAAVYVLSKNKLIWKTTNLLLLKNKDLKKLIRP